MKHDKRKEMNAKCVVKFEERDTNSRETCFTLFLSNLSIHFMENRPSIRFLRALIHHSFP